MPLETNFTVSSAYEAEKTDHLQSLGEKVGIPDDYDPGILETIPNTSGEIVVTLPCPEWTGMCPKTRQPDFGTITIVYVPDQKLVESKSLKLYLGSFRNHGCFHEDVIGKIHDDLASLLEPKRLHVRGDFNPRGGIGIQVSKESYKDNLKINRVHSLSYEAIVHPGIPLT